MGLSETIKEKLQHYYSENGIIPDERFACKMLDMCSGGNLERGMQCHIGCQYGEKMRIMVAAMDCGNGNTDVIEGRTSTLVKQASEKKLNPHMKGTYQALSYFLDDNDPAHLVNYMVMTNTCKCCYKDSMNHLPFDYYWNCKDHTLAEISIIAPEVILFQSQLSYVGCRDYMKPIAEIKDEDVKNNLRIFSKDGFKCYAVTCIHPSARGRSIRKRIDFYNIILPKIAEYIKCNRLI